MILCNRSEPLTYYPAVFLGSLFQCVACWPFFFLTVYHYKGLVLQQSIYIYVFLLNYIIFYYLKLFFSSLSIFPLIRKKRLEERKPFVRLMFFSNTFFSFHPPSLFFLISCTKQNLTTPKENQTKINRKLVAVCFSRDVGRLMVGDCIPEFT